ncbi:hypothetical protein AGABI2DRAFT_54830, partial [Agaricus bisporus var. bisporus H97]|uniref:hypothetical protein n=1 Tax=Agaricus bisporus var. bisporus (strain H97 / ATCC MYA-4626 / FGSC 10389) TaxID=936046 RepID=UPI00029F7A44
MAGETSKLKTRLASLNASLDELESLLEPLLTQSLPETLLNLDPVQQAKYQTVLPYVTYDLIFIYLKTKGLDPKTHGVVEELDRVRQYFQKIDQAENPPIRRSEVDKDAAGRFIKHAITQAKAKVATSSQPELPTQSTSVPLKVTTKMVARAQYERALEKEHDIEEDILDVYD